MGSPPRAVFSQQIISRRAKGHGQTSPWGYRSAGGPVGCRGRFWGAPGARNALGFLGNFCWLRCGVGRLCQLVKITNKAGNPGWGARSQRRGGFPRAPGMCAGSSGSPQSPAWHLPLEPQPAGASFLGWERQNSPRRRALGHRPLAPHRQALLGSVSGLFGVERLAPSSRGVLFLTFPF